MSTLVVSVQQQLYRPSAAMAQPGVIRTMTPKELLERGRQLHRRDSYTSTTSGTSGPDGDPEDIVVGLCKDMLTGKAEKLGEKAAANDDYVSSNRTERQGGPCASPLEDFVTKNLYLLSR